MPSTKRKASISKPSDLQRSPISSAAASAASAWDEHPGAFHFLTAVPPVTLACLLLSPMVMITWLGPWALVKLVLSAEVATQCQHAVTIYAAHANLDVQWVGDRQSHMRLAAAIAAGLVMGVAYRNTFRSLRWVLSGVGEDGDRSSASSSGRRAGRASVSLPLPRAPSVLVPLPTSTSVAATELVVKVLLPTAKFAKGMIYNERRTLQAFVDLESDEPNIAALVRLIATQGGDGGIKGYFAARREGAHLRIYVDRILTPPTHW